MSSNSKAKDGTMAKDTEKAHGQTAPIRSKHRRNRRHRHTPAPTTATVINNPIPIDDASKISDSFSALTVMPRYGGCDVQVVNEDTLDAVNRLRTHDGWKPLVLNMASDICPGGGWWNGALAQKKPSF